MKRSNRWLVLLEENLPIEDAREVRARYQAGDGSQRSLGHEYGVSRGTVRQILRGEIWKDGEE